MSASRTIEDFRSRAPVADPRRALADDPWNCIRRAFAPSAISTSGCLEGIPFLVKANLAVEGEMLDAASRVLEGYRSPFDATCVARLREAGAIPIGSTNMDEFGMGSSSEHSPQGAVEHPFAPGHVVGGSSGGSAVAVAVGLVPFALGSDTGGSVRQPAAFCGVVGLKPTWGAVSRWGLVAYASSLDTIGPITASVADAALVFSLLVGADPRDATSSTISERSPGRELEDGVEGLRIAWSPRWNELASEDVAADLRATLEDLERRGARCVAVELPAAEEILAAYAVLASAEAASRLARYDGLLYGRRADGEDLESTVRRTRSEGFGAEVQRRLLLGNFVLSEGWNDRIYRRARRMRRRIVDAFGEVLAEHDALVLPTSPTTAFERGARRDDPVALARSDLFTVAPSLAGVPALAVPTAPASNGLRHSVQVVARAHGEARMLRVGRAVERQWEGKP